ncbi:ABC transporter ATP-binding protein [Oceaniglobus trochenteri]|uniref:ABC transporter ATP-binding protein n=1 Tax=Oceaniglobus trochenteri TaxID=2763260 RepID=UPI001CFFC2C9|nr:sn-glycerol-3-phosphate ABC transporter ATP-binding protein UgpC [Oceaniglobus trochenteri]
MNALAIRNIQKSFGALKVLNGIDLTLEEGGFLVLLGPSGCGKSTLLSIIAGLEDASAGSIEIGGREATGLHPRDRDIAMVFQSYALYPSMQVERNMGFGLEMRGAGVDERKEKVGAAADLLGIGALLERKPAQLSGGQRQRVAMGRAIVRKPRLFLLDEPLSNLDAKLRTKMRGEIKKLHQSLGASIVYVTHDQVEAMTLATKVAVMRGGTIEQIGAPMTIYREPDNLFVAGFIGAPPMNFVRGRIVEGGGFAPDGGGDRITMPAMEHRLEPGREIVLGVRPENLRPIPPGVSPEGLLRFNAVPDVIEPMGADTMVHFRVGQSELIARLDGQTEVSGSAPMELGCEASALHLFDATTEQRLRPA